MTKVRTVTSMQGVAARIMGTPPAYGRVLGTWLLTRVIAVASIALTPRLLDDIDIYRGWLPFLHWAQFPLTDPKWQYPPGAGAVLLLPEFVHVDYAVAFAGVCLAVDAAILAALMLAHATRPQTSRAGVWLWAVAALVVGPIMYTRFDIVPALFAVGVVLLAARPALAGISAALGFVVKIWPAALLLALPRPATRRGVVAFILATVAALSLLALRFDDSLSFLANQKSRGLQVESTGALPFELFTLVGGKVNYGLQFGSYQVLMDGAELIGSVISFVGIALLAVIAWWRLSGRLESVDPGDVAVAVVLVTVATSRVYSPQYNVWIVAALAVALLSPRSRLRPTGAILVSISVLTQLVYPWFPYDLTDGNWPIVAVQCLRIGGLLVATVLALRAISRRDQSRDVARGILTTAGANPELEPDHAPREDEWTHYQDSRSRSA